MKFPKLLISMPILFSLLGCSGGGYAATYSFQLGQKEGSHAAISITLSDQLYTGDNEEIKAHGAKLFDLNFDIKGFSLSSLNDSLNDATSEELSSEALTSEELSSDVLSSEELSSEVTTSESDSGIFDGGILTGYYYTSNEFAKTGEILHLGIEVFETFNISPAVTEKILYATVNDSEIDVVIPVSMTDLYYQLYWYGYRVSSFEDIIAPVNVLEENPDFIPLFEGNAIGTHPTKEAIDAIKAYQNKRKTEKPEGYEESEDIFTSYRDFHTLNMGLKKNG